MLPKRTNYDGAGAAVERGRDLFLAIIAMENSRHNPLIEEDPLQDGAVEVPSVETLAGRRSPVPRGLASQRASRHIQPDASMVGRHSLAKGVTLRICPVGFRDRPQRSAHERQL